nr:F-box only protein 11-like isoform X1 [Biomphalaria glabrata]
MSTRSARTTRLKTRNLRKKVQSKSRCSKYRGTEFFSCDAPSSGEDKNSRYYLRRRRSQSTEGVSAVSTSEVSQPPLKKRRKSNVNPALQPQGRVAARYLQHELPDEVMFYIFSFLKELDLCNAAQVCRRFQAITNDHELWKVLYMEVFEYDSPLMNPEPRVFQFVSADDPNYDNPWKESFKQLYRGIHVSRHNIPLCENNKGKRMKGRNIIKFDTIESAYNFVDTEELEDALIFIHSGTYHGEFLLIDSPVSMIGAASGNVMDNVIIERETESTIMFVEGCRRAYLGYVTLKFSPDSTSTVPHHRHYALEVAENTQPIIDHCKIKSLSVAPINDSISCHTLSAPEALINDISISCHTISAPEAPINDISISCHTISAPEALINDISISCHTISAPEAPINDISISCQTISAPEALINDISISCHTLSAPEALINDISISCHTISAPEAPINDSISCHTISAPEAPINDISISCHTLSAPEAPINDISISCHTISAPEAPINDISISCHTISAPEAPINDISISYHTLSAPEAPINDISISCHTISAPEAPINDISISCHTISAPEAPINDISISCHTLSAPEALINDISISCHTLSAPEAPINDISISCHTLSAPEAPINDISISYHTLSVPEALINDISILFHQSLFTLSTLDQYFFV